MCPAGGGEPAEHERPHEHAPVLLLVIKIFSWTVREGAALRDERTYT